MSDNILNNPRALNRFLDRERMKNVALIRRYYPAIDDADVDNIYQDACIAMFTNIQSGKLTEFTCLPSSYFTQICLFQASKFARDNKLHVSYNEASKDHNESEEDEPNNYDEDRLNDLLEDDEPDFREQMAVMRGVVSMLPPPCEQILWAFYGKEKMSMERIAAMLDYKNADTVKAKKSQCMNKLKKTISERLGMAASELAGRTYANREKFAQQFKDIKINDDEDR